MYTVRELLRRSTSISVTVYEQYDTVGGLLHRGVSPDHVGVREMIRRFDVPFHDDRVTVVLNTEIGLDTTIDELRTRFDAVIFACGASQPRQVGPTTDGDGTYQAIDILVAENIGSSGFPPPTPAGPTCIVIGAGNVAFDIVRWVAKTRHRASAGDQIRELVVLSRSAPDCAAFTPSAFYELLDLEHTEVLIDGAGSTPGAGADSSLLRELSRLPSTDVHGLHALPTDTTALLRIILSFGQDVADLAKTDLGVVITTTAGRTFRANSAICATGFTTKRIDGVPLDTRGVVPNLRGQVISYATGEPLEGLYVVGWAKRGASGGVGDNRTCAAETVTQLAANFRLRV